MNRTKGKLVMFMILVSSISACNNRYNDTMEWAAHIPSGTSIDAVKVSQPGYVGIAWDKPDTTFDSTVLYSITKIRWNWDPLHMDNRLAFRNNKFIGRWASK